MAPPRKRGLPKPLPDGFILTDTEKKTWRLGKIIGQGGFGLIFLASQDVDAPVSADTNFVIKVEYHENGPLFSELKFYQRAAKAESIQRWMRSRKLDFLGIPTYWGSGLAEHNGIRYRFMAMDRLGSDLQKVCDRNGGRLKKATVLWLGGELLDMLEYIHDNEYVHADIKAANLMLGHTDPDKVYLADYGLSYRYCPDGVHKEYKENPKKGHNGTIEYTSLDAHNGAAPSRRGDLQVLGFCLLHWLCGALPWDSALKNPTQVQEAKARLMDNLPSSVQQLSMSGGSTDEVARFLLYVKTLGYKDRPDYQRLKELLGSSGQGRLDLSGPQGECAGASHTSKPRTLDPAAKGKQKAGQARGSSKPKPVDVDDEEEEQQQRPTPVPARNIRGPPLYKPDLKPGRARGPSMPKPVAVEMDEEEETKPKPVPARYIRGPPITRPQPEQKTGRAKTAARSSRPKPEPMEVDEDDADDEEEARPKPIPACYIRGPPIGPRPQPQQAKTKPKRPIRKTRDDDVSMTTRQEVQQRLRPVSRKHATANGDLTNQRQKDYTGRYGHLEEPMYDDDYSENWDYYPNGQWQGDGHHGQPHYDLLGTNTSRYRPGVSLVRGPEEEPGPKRTPGWNVGVYCAAFMAMCLFLVALVALR